MRHGSLFSGIGGFDLAANWIGWDNIIQCEKDEFCQKVLKYHFPKTILYGDIKTTDFTIHRGGIDVLTGGFPCQPYSIAGKRKGKEDDRHLWPEMLRAIREIQPSWIVGENVYGLINWNRGMVFNEVLADLETAGYEVWPYVLPACAVNAPHRRDRIWFIAHATSTGREERIENNRSKDATKSGTGMGIQPKRSVGIRPLADPETERLQGQWRFGEAIEIKRNIGTIRANEGDSQYIIPNPNSIGQINGLKQRKPNKQGYGSVNGYKNDWTNWPTQSPICNGDNGIPTGLDGITVPKWRNESIKGAGQRNSSTSCLQYISNDRTIRIFICQ